MNKVFEIIAIIDCPTLVSILDFYGLSESEIDVDTLQQLR